MVFFKVLTVAALALGGVQADNGCGKGGEPVCVGRNGCDQGYVSKGGICVLWETFSNCGKGGEPVCKPPFVDRQYECDFGFFGREGTCVPYELPADDPAPVPAPSPGPVPGPDPGPAPSPSPANCGGGGEPVCTAPFTGGRQFECDFGFVGDAGICVTLGDAADGPSAGPGPAPGPEALENCGEGGEPACRFPFTDREFECNKGFVGEGEGEDRVCVPYVTPEDCGRDQQPVCIGEKFECMFGYVGADAEGGRICVPDEEESGCPEDCGSIDQPACEDRNPECCYGFVGRNVRGQGRMCVYHVSRIVEEKDPMEGTRKLLAASIF